MAVHPFVFFRSLLFFGVGTALILGDFLWIGATVASLRTAISVTGVVVDQPVGGGYHPDVTYVTADGIEARTSMSSGLSWVDVGEEVDLLYWPGDVHSATIDRFGSLWGPKVALFGMGTAFVVAAGASWVSASRRRT